VAHPDLQLQAAGSLPRRNVVGGAISLPLFGTISSFACWYGFISGLVALFRREQVAGPSLNGWDEMLAFFALKYLAQFLSVVVG